MQTQVNDTQTTTRYHGHHHAPVVTPSQPTKIDQEVAIEKNEFDLMKDLINTRYGAKNAATADKAIDNVEHVLDTIAAKADATSPFDFDDSLTFTYRDSIFALANAIEGLLSMQPQLIAGEMAISTELVSPQVTKWSNAFLEILQNYESQIAALGPEPKAGTLATLQGAMSVANANASSSSTALNGVLSMLTSGTSSKTSTYQNLIQQVQSIVTALLNAMVQDWT